MNLQFRETTDLVYPELWMAYVWVRLIRAKKYSNAALLLTEVGRRWRYRTAAHLATSIYPEHLYYGGWGKDVYSMKPTLCYSCGAIHKIVCLVPITNGCPLCWNTPHWAPLQERRPAWSSTVFSHYITQLEQLPPPMLHHINTALTNLEQTTCNK